LRSVRRTPETSFIVAAIAVAIWILRKPLALVVMVAKAYLFHRTGWVSEKEHQWWLSEARSIAWRYIRPELPHDAKLIVTVFMLTIVLGISTNLVRRRLKKLGSQ